MKHSTKRALAIGAAALMATGLVACSSEAAPSGDAGSGIPAMSMTLGHSYAPDSLQHRAAEQLAELVSEKSDGAITISVFPSAQLGS
jgi:TRAP-type C4-dicarboxylate transport system substrate-binding protein